LLLPRETACLGTGLWRVAGQLAFLSQPRKQTIAEDLGDGNCCS